MVDNFTSAGTNGDADEELPAPYGTGPKNRTTEEQHRSDYGYAEPERTGDGWRERSTALDGLDPSPSLPNAPRSYERGPVPQQPYVPKPPFLPGPPPAAAPERGGYPAGGQQYGGEQSYGEQNRSYGESYGESSSDRYDESPFAPRTDESPFAPRTPYQEQSPFRPSQQQPGHQPSQQPSQPAPQPPQQQGPPTQAQQNPFAPSRNGISGPPQPQAQPPAQPSTPPPSQSQAPLQPPSQSQARPTGPGPGNPGPGGPAQAGLPRPHSSNGLSSSSNGWNPTPPQNPQQHGPTSNGLSSSNGPSNNAQGNNGLGSNGLGNNGLGNPGQGHNGPGSNGLSSSSGGPSQSASSPAGPPPGGAAPNRPAASAPTGWSSPAPAAGPAPAAANGYPSDPSAEYESNAAVSNPAAQASENKPLGARRRADVQQDAPSQVPAEPSSSHRAGRRVQPTASTSSESAGTASTPSAPSTPNTPADGSKRPRRYRIHHLRDMKNRGEKWAMLTAYDQYTAEIFDQSGIPVLLVGDSAANNVYGYESTLRVTVDELIPLARAVAGAVEHALVVADLPFGSYQASPEQAFHTAVRFMKEAGVHAVKLEGGRTVVPAVEKLTQAGIPVMAHIGFTPQSEHSIGGYRVQGRGDQAAGLIDDAVALAEAGAFSVVLEMVPGDVAAEITKRIPVPTIGIGAGRDTDAQVLVWQDMAGLRSGPMPRFVKQYADLRGILTAAATTYAAEVASGTFPTDEHTF